MIDLTKVTDIVFADIDFADYPDFSDAYIESADYNGQPMTQGELEQLQANSDFFYNELEKSIY
jgi:hypothetical protein